MTGSSYATSAEMAGELGAFPASSGTATRCSASCATTRRAAHGQAARLRAAAHHPVPLDARAPAPTSASSTHAVARVGPRGRARRGARLPQRPGDRHRADRHDRPRHGLRHHRHRAGLRAGEIQEARRRRLLQDHQPRGAGGAPRRSATREREIDAIDRLRGRPRHAEGRARRSTTTR